MVALPAGWKPFLLGAAAANAATVQNARAWSGPEGTRVVFELSGPAEHRAFAIELEDLSSGYGRRHRLDLDFVAAGEFRTLAAAYVDVRELIARLPRPAEAA